MLTCSGNVRPTGSANLKLNLKPDRRQNARVTRCRAVARRLPCLGCLEFGLKQVGRFRWGETHLLQTLSESLSRINLQMVPVPASDRMPPSLLATRTVPLSRKECKRNFSEFSPPTFAMATGRETVFPYVTPNLRISRGLSIALK